MWVKIKRAFTNNVSLKILAIGLGIFLWLVVVNVDNPNQTKTFTTVVQILNEETLTEDGKYYTVQDESLAITFRATAKRSIIENLSNSDFTATADMNYMDENGRIPIDISVSERYASSVSVSAKQQYLKVYVGEQRSSRYVIEPEIVGTPAEGFVVDEVSVTPNVITIVGPQEIVSTIDKVKAVCDVSNIGSKITTSVVPVVYDRNGAEVDTTKLELSVTMVDMSVTLASTKTVDVTINTSGTLSDDLELAGITTDPRSLEIKGSSGAINAVTSITIPSSVINLSEITETMTTTVDITSYLPDGVTLVDDSKAQVKVTVNVLGKQAKKYKINTANLTVRNLQEGYKASFEDAYIEVTIVALQSRLDNLDAASITGYVDVSGLTLGTHTVPLSLQLNDGLDAEDVTIKVVIEPR